MATVTINGEKISEQTEVTALEGDEYFLVQKGNENKKFKSSNLISSTVITDATKILEE